MFNLSLIYARLNQPSKACEIVDRYMKYDNLDAAHISHAVEMYAEMGRDSDARSAFEKLKEVSQAQANLLLLRATGKTRHVLGW